jgi:hypothetical protein
MLAQIDACFALMPFKFHKSKYTSFVVTFCTKKKPAELPQQVFWIRTSPFGEILIAATDLTPDSNNGVKYNVDIKEVAYVCK